MIGSNSYRGDCVDSDAIAFPPVDASGGNCKRVRPGDRMTFRNGRYNFTNSNVPRYWLSVSVPCELATPNAGCDARRIQPIPVGSRSSNLKSPKLSLTQLAGGAPGTCNSTRAPGTFSRPPPRVTVPPRKHRVALCRFR